MTKWGVLVVAFTLWPACKGNDASTAKPCQPSNPEQCQEACEKGNMPSCTSLGILHKNSKAYEKAFPLFEKACNKNDMRGCDELAAAYMLGHSVAVDRKRAMDLFAKACNGFAPACTNLGAMHCEDEDHKKGHALFEKACTGGDFMGCSNLGSHYLQGQGVPQDLERARELYEKACNGGDAKGCESLKHLRQQGL